MKKGHLGKDDLFKDVGFRVQSSTPKCFLVLWCKYNWQLILCQLIYIGTPLKTSVFSIILKFFPILLIFSQFPG